METEFLPKRQVALLLRVSTRTVERLVWRGVLTPYLRSRRTYFLRRDVVLLLQQENP